MNIIEQLKKNEKPFGLMSEEMQAKARELGQGRFVLFVCQGDGFWDYHFDHSGDFDNARTYRLRSDYAEEPEIVIQEWPIFTKDGTLRFARHLADRDERGTEIDLAVRDPDFIGFNADGWIWGCLYKNKKDPSMVHYMIKEHDLPLYDVISLGGGKVLFRRQK